MLPQTAFFALFVLTAVSLAWLLASPGKVVEATPAADLVRGWPGATSGAGVMAQPAAE